jgi:hypothetical protein
MRNRGRHVIADLDIGSWPVRRRSEEDRDTSFRH